MSRAWLSLVTLARAGLSATLTLTGMTTPPQRRSLDVPRLGWAHAPVAAATLLLAFAGGASSHAAEAVQHLVVTARVGARTQLRASTDVLVFTVLPGQTRATATLGYEAAIRTTSAAHVVLSVETDAIEGPASALDLDATVAVDAGGLEHPLLPGMPVRADSWIGSGSRRGRLTFTLRSAAPGTYVVPVRLMVTTP